MGQELASLEAFATLWHKPYHLGSKNSNHDVPRDVEIGN